MKHDNSSEEVQPAQKGNKALFSYLKTFRSSSAPIEPISRSEEGIPLAFPQEALWFIHKMSDENVSDHIWLGWTIEGDLDVDSLQGAWNDLVARHESLRTRIIEREGKGYLKVEEALSTPIAFHSLKGLAPDDRESEKIRRCAELYQERFDFDKAPLFRLLLLELEPNVYVHLLVIHHIIFDGGSLAILHKELAAFYKARKEGSDPELPELKVQYPDFANWQKTTQLTESRLTELSQFWKEALPRDLEPLELPTDRPRPAIQRYKGDAIPISLPPELIDRIRRTGREEGCSLFVTLQACLKTLLHRLTGQDDIILGSPLALRDKPELATMVGMLVNILPVRTNFSGDPTFLEILRREREAMLSALSHRDLPFHHVVQAVKPKRDMSRNPIFQAGFVILPEKELELEGIRSTPLPFQGKTAQMDLTFQLRESSEGLKGYIEYNSDLFDRETIIRFQEHFVDLIQKVADSPDARLSQFSIVSEEKRKTMLQDWNDTSTDFPENKGIHHWFEEIVGKRASETAVAFDGESLTFEELDRRANQVAHYLKSLGVGPEKKVGLYQERSLEMMVGVLGILKSGGAYVPMDPAYPRERVRHILEDSEASVILTNEALAKELPNLENCELVCFDSDAESLASQSDEAPDYSDFRSNNLAYIIFTSGSTGRPKGVMVEHASVSNFFTAMDEVIDHDPPGVWLSVASLCFDISVLEVLWTITRGFKVVIYSDQLEYSIPRLISEHKVTHMQCVPTMARMLLADSEGVEGFRQLEYLVMGGEAVPGTLAEQLIDLLKGKMRVMYGPTETTVISSGFPAQADCNVVPIGKPVANTTFYILDSYGQPTPIGIPGELYIGGKGVARGYINQPALTDERFIPNPFLNDGSRLFRTGDQAFYRPDGIVEFLGRLDFQVKIRGYRVELPEVQAVLSEASNGGADVIVETWAPNPTTEARLVAYLVAKEGGYDLCQIQEEAKRNLPDYMIPQHYLELDRFPKTNNGKIDRKLLPAPELSGLEEKRPLTDIERRVAKAWQKKVSIDDISQSDNFFDLGGHSLSAVEVAVEIGREFGLTFSAKNLMEEPRLDQLSMRVEAELEKKRDRARGIMPVEGVVESLKSEAKDQSGRFTQKGLALTESFWGGLKNRLFQLLAFNAPASLRGKLHRARGVRMGDNVIIGNGAMIETAYPQLIEIGNQVQIGIRTTIIGHFGETIGNALSEGRSTVQIEDDVYIGLGVIILPNVRIGKGSVVTAGSVVNESVPPNTVVQGNPAKPVAKCNQPLAFNSYSKFIENLEVIEEISF